MSTVYDHRGATYVINEEGYYKIENGKLEVMAEFIPIAILNKPPLGLKPQFVWYGQRIEEIESAIDRYNAVDKVIPKEWITELIELTKMLL